MNQDVFKGVLWDHGTVVGPDGKTYHKTAVVGVLLTEEPLRTSTKSNHEFVFGNSWGQMEEGFNTLRTFKSNRPMGDASQVLTGLDQIQPAGEDSE